jgi:hypothetical protein
MPGGFPGWHAIVGGVCGRGVCEDSTLKQLWVAAQIRVICAASGPCQSHS